MATGNALEQESIVFIELDELDRQLNELRGISDVLESRLSRVMVIPTNKNEAKNEAKIGIPDSHSIGSSELAVRISAQSISVAKITDLLSSIMYRLEV